MQFGVDSAAEAPEASAAVPDLVAATAEQRLFYDDQVLPVWAPFGTFHRHHDTRAGWTTSTIFSRRCAPCRLGQSMVLPRLRPISPALIGVSTETRPAAMSASLG